MLEPSLDLNAMRDREGPVFHQPWQAQAFSLLVALHEAGHFTWEDWVQTFSNVIKRAPAKPDETGNDAYYRQWASALEEMTISLGILKDSDISAREKEWKQAYLNTPHGQFVHLLNATCPPAHVHHHVTAGAPAAISPAS